MKKKVQTVGVIGSGPAGAALASFLAMKGVEVTLFDDGRRPDLIVGESLIPAIIPVLRKLGLEDRVAEIGLYKPGVSFTFGREEEIDFCFKSVEGCDLPTYAYNVPRPAFDALLDERATQLGARRVPARAKLERVGEEGLRLSDETLALAPWLNGRQPDLLVDSTGRSRLFARTLDIPADLGPRRDVAYFAHYHGFKEKEPRGQVIIGRLAHGWSWRIPLRDCVSVGVVMNKDDAAALGGAPEERLENAIAQDPVLAESGSNRQRITEIATYTNYQLVSRRGFGPGWVMTGDAFGFVDPMLSPGLWLALRSAELLTENLDNLSSYARQINELIRAWMELIEYYYNGKMFAMYHTGMALERKYPVKASKVIHKHIETQIACMASGASTLSRYSRGMVKFMARHGIWKSDPAALAIR
jgi:flavin-dependent dehydrogenase